MVDSSIQRFDIYLVELNPTKGREINKTRPCVVISPNELFGLSTVIVAPMTSKGFNLPCRLAIHFQDKDGLIVLDQMRAVDKSRLIKKMGVIEKGLQTKLCRLLKEMFEY